LYPKDINQILQKLLKLNEIKTQWIVATVFFYKKIGF